MAGGGGGGGGDMPSELEPADACSSHVAAIFPNICPRHVAGLAADLDYDANAVVNFIADHQAQGKPYPTRPRPKRKREPLDDEAQELARVKRVYDVNDPAAPPLPSRLAHRIRDLLCFDFPEVPFESVQTALETARNLLLPAYLALSDSVRQQRAASVAPPRPRGHYAPDSIAGTIRHSRDPDLTELLLQLQAARRIAADRERKRQAQLDRERAEAANFQEAMADGFTKECECCFADFAFNRLTQCSGDTAHWFCFQCCRRQAETLVGLSKYELTCLSMDGCQAPFSHAERQRFLDQKLALALDRAEQEAVLRLAGIENLASCPFCPFAAECSPAEVDREFRCQNPECQIVSCRLCSKETHIPKTCEEAAKEHGFSARRAIEEAMSAAMIRRCNKCDTPFIKEDGCNKMTCTRPNCRNVQCYVCSESCDYAHFNDPSRGGKPGNCPLFDSVEARHAGEIEQAETNARKQVVDANPSLDPELLKFHMSDRVATDDKQREQVRGAPRGIPYQPQPLPRYEGRHRHQGPAAAGAHRIDGVDAAQMAAAAHSMAADSMAARTALAARLAAQQAAARTAAAAQEAAARMATAAQMVRPDIYHLRFSQEAQVRHQMQHIQHMQVHGRGMAVMAGRQAVPAAPPGGPIAQVEQYLRAAGASPAALLGLGSVAAGVGVRQPQHDGAPRVTHQGVARVPRAGGPAHGGQARPRDAHRAGPVGDAPARPRAVRDVGRGPADKQQGPVAAAAEPRQGRRAPTPGQRESDPDGFNKLFGLPDPHLYREQRRQAHPRGMAPGWNINQGAAPRAPRENAADAFRLDRGARAENPHF